MRKFTNFLIAVVALTVSAACNGGGAESATVADNTQTQPPSSGKALVVYFSHAGDNYAVGDIEVGNTKKLAELIAGHIDADLFEIKTSKYDGMAYKPLCDLAKEEQQRGELPPYEGKVENLDRYDTIFIGGPVWWGTYPQVMFTFLADNKAMMAGKTIVPFTTHEGSGLGRCVEDLKKTLPGATVTDGLAVRGADAQSDAAARRVGGWLAEKGF